MSQGLDSGKKGWLSRSLDWGYLLQDAGEYNVQTKVGIAILMTKTVQNSKTKETLSLWDAYQLNGDGTVTMKEGFDTLLDKKGGILRDWNEKES